MDIEQLIALANFLDESGATEEADRIDALIKDAADKPPPLDLEELDRILEQKQQKQQFEAPNEYNARVMKESPSLEQWTVNIQDELTSYLNTPEEKTYYNLLDALKQYQVRWQAEHGKSATTSDVFEKLSAIADRLDSLGATDEADAVDAFIAKHAAKKKDAPAPAAEAPVSKADQVLEVKPEADTEQSKRYDDKHHHSLQVREPKSQKERMDLEGYKDTHHVHTYQPVKEAMEKEAASTRYCPEHIGVSLGRVGEATYQCPLDGKTYNWEVGYTDYDGKHHEGGSVAAQTPDSSGYEIPHRIFDSRENILNRVN